MRIISGNARGTKLFTLEGIQTRPTLDRVKESLFNIIGLKLKDSLVLDLFAGSGALGLEAVSRGAKMAVFCENNKDAIEIIKKNIQKTHFANKTELFEKDFRKALSDMEDKKMKFDFIFLDPPYKTNLICESLKQIINCNILSENAILVIETDEPDRIKQEIEEIDIDIYDERKYGRVSLLFSTKKI